MKPYKRIITIPRRLPPFLGIPLPGERPFVVDASRFAAVQRITNVVAWDVERLDNGRRVLHIVHNTKGVKGKIKFYEIPLGWKHTMALWRDSQMKRKTTGAKDKHQTAIARLTKDLKQIRAIAPRNPLLPSDRESYDRELPEDRLCPNHNSEMAITGNARHYVMACIESDCAFSHYEYMHSELRWHLNKPLRKALAKVTAFAFANPTKKSDAYERIQAVTGRAPLFKYAQRKKQHETWTPIEYWQHLPEVCGMSKPYRDRETEITERLKSHAESRRGYATAMREAVALRSQIAELQELANLAALVKKPARNVRHCTRFGA